MNLFKFLLFAPIFLFSLDPMMNGPNPDAEMQERSSRYYSDLGKKAFQDNKLDDAFNDYSKALVFSPRFAPAHFGMAQVYEAQNKIKNAIQEYKAAIIFNKGFMAAYYRLCLLYQKINDQENVFNTYLKAISVDSRFPNTGAEVEVHERIEEEIESLQKVISQKALQGKMVYIYSEEGFSQAYLLARYIPQLEALGAIISFEPPRGLESLFASSFPNIKIIDWYTLEESIQFDYKISLSALGLILNADIHNIPGKEGYLKVNKQAMDSFQGWISKSHPRIGLAPKLKSKIFPLKLVASNSLASYYLLQTINAQLYEDLSQSLDLSELVESFDSIEEIAGAISLMDETICADNEIALLSCALGIPTTIIYEEMPNLFWLENEGKTPWFTHAKLIKKSSWLEAHREGTAEDIKNK